MACMGHPQSMGNLGLTMRSRRPPESKSLQASPSSPWRVGRPMRFHPLLKSITESELQFIASRDYDEDSSRHLEALRSVVLEQDGRFRDDQSWFPREVVELGAYSLVPGHEREFFICTMLVLFAIQHGESTVDPESLFASASGYYDLLEPDLREEVLRAFERIQA